MPAQDGTHGIHIVEWLTSLERMELAVDAHPETHVGLLVEHAIACPLRPVGGGCHVEVEHRLVDALIVGHEAPAQEGAAGHHIVVGLEHRVGEFGGMHSREAVALKGAALHRVAHQVGAAKHLEVVAKRGVQTRPRHGRRQRGHHVQRFAHLGAKHRHRMVIVKA